MAKKWGEVTHPTFSDGEPVPESYSDWVSRLIDAAVEYEERYGSEEERIQHPEDWE